MPEIKREAQAYIINYACDDCIGKIGCMLASNDGIELTYPRIYCYECPICKKEYNFNVCYPRVVIE